ncbi:MAG: glutathione S-transferase family protein [Kiloniellaceae bacterium]
MLKILGRKTSGNVQKVVWLLEELGQAYEREDYGRQFGNTQEPDYLALNPNGKVPTLVDGDTSIWESNTILRYLAGKAGNAFYPADPAARSHVERWMDWQLASLNEPYLTIFKESKKAPEERAANFAESAKALDAQLQILDGALGETDWLAGPEMTLADICLGPIVDRCLNFPIELSALPKVRAWRDGYAERPAYKKAVG